MDHISYSYCVGGNIVRMTTPGSESLGAVDRSLCVGQPGAFLGIPWQQPPNYAADIAAMPNIQRLKVATKFRGTQYIFRDSCRERLSFIVGWFKNAC